MTLKSLTLNWLHFQIGDCECAKRQLRFCSYRPPWCGHSWLAGAPATPEGEYAKYFGNRVYGSHQNAFLVAKEWRNLLLKKIKEGEKARICTRSSRNRSGVVGVSQVTGLINGAEYRFWQATCSPSPGRRRCVKFSVMRYGDQVAFRLAVKAREKGIGS